MLCRGLVGACSCVSVSGFGMSCDVKGGDSCSGPVGYEKALCEKAAVVSEASTGVVTVHVVTATVGAVDAYVIAAGVGTGAASGVVAAGAVAAGIDAGVAGGIEPGRYFGSAAAFAFTGQNGDAITRPAYHGNT